VTALAVPAARAGGQRRTVRGPLRAYGAYATAGARLELAARSAFVGRAAFLAVILFVFSRIWALVVRQGGLGDRSGADLLWYIALTEWVMLSIPAVHLEVENDLRSGDLVARLSQPVSYPAARLAEAGGAAAVRLLLLGPVALAAAAVMAGGFPREPGGLVLAVPAGILATTLAVISVGGIGACAVWLHDTSPVYWIWSKLAFMLGGLMLPLEVYPGWLRTFASWTPFGAMLNGTGRMAFGFDPGEAAGVVASLAAWLVVISLGVALLWRRSLRALDGYGG